MIQDIIVRNCTCEYLDCRHAWITRSNEIPEACPRCHRRTWNNPSKVASQQKRNQMRLQPRLQTRPQTHSGFASQAFIQPPNYTNPVILKAAVERFLESNPRPSEIWQLREWEKEIESRFGIDSSEIPN